MVKAARSLQLFGFICVNLFLVAVAAGRCVAVRGSYFSNRRPAALLRESGLTVRGQKAPQKGAKLRSDKWFVQKMPSFVQYQHSAGEPGHQEYFDFGPFQCQGDRRAP
jgi:hypothetical protein